MAIVPLQTGLFIPGIVAPNGGPPAPGTAGTLDATAEKVAFFGRISIAGRGSSKVLSAAGGGSLIFRVGALTWANASTVLRIGLQDYDLTANNPSRPDGTFDVYRDLVPGTDTLTANTTHSFAMTGGSGTKTLSHGDLVAVVFDMTNRAGSDSVIIQGYQHFNQVTPAASLFTGSWANATNIGPLVGIIFDDGTYGSIMGVPPILSGSGTHSYNDSNNPDEYGTSFELPWDCKVDTILGYGLPGATSQTFEFQIYADPLGTPTSILPGGTAIAAVPFEYRANGVLGWWRPLAAEISLTRNTKYAVTAKSTNSSNVMQMAYHDYLNAGWKRFTQGGEYCSTVTRNNGSGAFTEATTRLSALGVIISGWPEASGGGGGGASFSAYAM